MPYRPRGNFSATPFFRLTRPLSPNVLVSLPVLAFSVKRNPFMVPATICAGKDSSPGQYAIPRPDGEYSDSYSQTFFPVSGSRATIRPYGLDRKNRPPATSGVACDARLR